MKLNLANNSLQTLPHEIGLLRSTHLFVVLLYKPVGSEGWVFCTGLKIGWKDLH